MGAKPKIGDVHEHPLEDRPHRIAARDVVEGIDKAHVGGDEFAEPRQLWPRKSFEEIYVAVEPLSGRHETNRRVSEKNKG